jgi:phage terminase large subunit-like protein
MVGFGPDPEQSLALDHMFAVDKRGKSCSFEICVICARQNLKTGLFKLAALGWLFITDQNLVVWSAHEFSTAQEAFRDMEILIGGCAALSRRIKRVHRAAGSEAIELRTGQRLKFKARTKSGGRGLTGDKIVLDEAFALQPDHMGALMPTLSVVPDPQIVYGSSAGRHESGVLRKVRDRGRSGRSPRLFYCEWCAPKLACENEKCDHEPGSEGCQLDVVENWKQGNPLLGRMRSNGTSLTEEYVRAEREGMPPAEFARERLGWWDDPTATDLFGVGKWEAGKRPARPIDLGVSALAVAVSIDLTHSAIVAAAADDPDVWVKPLHHGPGMRGVVDRCVELQAQYGVDVVIDGKGPGAFLIPELQNSGVRLHIASTGDVLDAFANLETKVRDGQFLHVEAKELDEAAAGAMKRPVGERYALGRKMSETDISPLEAASLAAWHAGVASAPTESAYEDEDLMVV